MGSYRKGQLASGVWIRLLSGCLSYFRVLGLLRVERERTPETWGAERQSTGVWDVFPGAFWEF